MAEPENEELDLIEDTEADEVEEEEQDQLEAGEEEPDDSDEVIVFEDEAAPASGDADTDLVKHLRGELRRALKERDELRKSAPQQKPIEVGEKPTLAGCDYDEDRYEAELDGWKERKAKAEAQVQDGERARQAAAEEWAKEVEAHRAKRAALRFSDAQEAEETATASLSDIQQAVIVKASDNSAMVFYALGKNPGKLAEVSKITDPIKLAVAISKLEGKMQVKKRGAAPEPERIAKGSAPASASRDKELERLEKDAERTGDRTKVIAYKAKLKAQAK